MIERSLVIYQKRNLSVKKSRLCRDCSQVGPAAQPLLRRSAIEDRVLIGAALAEAKARVSGPYGAAAKLGIPPSTLESKIRSMNINKYSFRTAS